MVKKAFADGQCGAMTAHCPHSDDPQLSLFVITIRHSV